MALIFAFRDATGQWHGSPDARMSVQGMFFDIATGTVMILDEALPGFRPVTAGDDEPDLLADPA